MPFLQQCLQATIQPDAGQCCILNTLSRFTSVPVHTESVMTQPTSAAATQPASESPLVHRTATALLVAVVFFMETLDSTVITTALPAMAQDFSVAPVRLSAGVSAYLIALTVFIPLSGWVADRFGPRRVFAWAIGVFTLASLLCALSNSLLTFTLARILQGSAGAMMVPVGRLVVMRETPKAELVKTVALFTWPALLGPILGPAIGGWITTQWSWHWIFLLNLPVGLAALAAALWLIRPHRLPTEHFDMRGFLLCGSGIGLLMTGVESASHGGQALWWALGFIITGLLLLAGCVMYLSRAPQPLFRLEILRVRSFSSAVGAGSLSRIALSAAPFLLPLLFQLGFGFSAVQSGTLLLWLFAGNLAMKPATTWLMNRYGFRRILLVNSLLVFLSFVAYALMNQNTPPLWIGIILFITGMARSMQFTAFYTLGFADIGAREMSDANTLFGMAQRLNSGLGIAVGALMLSFASWLQSSNEHLPDVSDFRIAFALISLLALATFIDVMRLPADAGESVLKRGKAGA